MEIPSNSTFASQVKLLKTERNQDEPFGKEVSAAAHERNEIRKNAKLEVSLNQQIIESTFQSTVVENPLSILSRETIDQVIASLNEQFEEARFEIDDIQTAYDNGLDVSPEATADRIVSLSTGFFGAFREQNSDLSDAEVLESFVKTISGGIDQGFEEARNILKSLDVLDQGEIASNIDKTYELVQEGLKSFLDGFLETEEPQLPNED